MHTSVCMICTYHLLAPSVTAATLRRTDAAGQFARRESRALGAYVAPGMWSTCSSPSALPCCSPGLRPNRLRVQLQDELECPLTGPEFDHLASRNPDEVRTLKGHRLAGGRIAGIRGLMGSTVTRASEKPVRKSPMDCFTLAGPAVHQGCAWSITSAANTSSEIVKLPVFHNWTWRGSSAVLPALTRTPSSAPASTAPPCHWQS